MKSLKIDRRLQCSLDLQLDNLISLKERDSLDAHHNDNDNVGSVDTFQEKNHFNSYQRNHLGPTILIIPGHLKNCIQKSRKKNCKKKIRFLDYEHKEFSSEVDINI